MTAARKTKDLSRERERGRDMADFWEGRRGEGRGEKEDEGGRIFFPEKMGSHHHLCAMLKQRSFGDDQIGCSEGRHR